MGLCYLMSYQFLIAKKHNCIFIKYCGEIDFGEIRVSVAEFTASPDHQSGMDLFRDFSEAEILLDDSLESVKEVITSRSDAIEYALGKNRKVAWVLSNAKDFRAIHKLTTISRLNHLDVSRQPFREITTALKWLDLPEDLEIEYPDKWR